MVGPSDFYIIDSSQVVIPFALHSFCSQLRVVKIVYVIQSLITVIIICCYIPLKNVSGAVAKLLNATMSCFMSICLSIRLSVPIEQFGSHWTDFHEI
jgi:hypothetical protein